MPFKILKENEKLKKGISNEELAFQFHSKNEMINGVFPSTEFATLGDFLCSTFSEAMDKDLLCGDNDYHSGKCNGMMLMYSPKASKGVFYNVKSKTRQFKRCNKKLMLTADNIYNINTTGFNGVLLSTNLHYGLKKKQKPNNTIGQVRTETNSSLAYICNIDIDFDDVYYAKGLGKILDLIKKGQLLKPTILVNTGSGFHFIYRLKTPIRVYNNPQLMLAFRNLKQCICDKISKAYFGKEGLIDALSLDQNIRCPFSTTKYGETLSKEESKDYLVTAFEIGDSYTVNELAIFSDIEYRQMLPYCTYINNSETDENHLCPTQILKISKEETEKSFDFLKAVITKEQTNEYQTYEKYWGVSKNVYNGWLKRCRNEVKVGHRYHSLCGAVVYAKKCGIAKAKLEENLMELATYWTERDGVAVTKADVDSALTLLSNPKIIKYKGEYIANKAGLTIKKCKRNGKTRAEHLKSISDKTGRKSKKTELFAFLSMLVKKGKKIDEMSVRELEQETGISKSTVAKYLKNCIKLLRKKLSILKAQAVSVRKEVRRSFRLKIEKLKSQIVQIKDILNIIVQNTEAPPLAECDISPTELDFFSSVCPKIIANLNGTLVETPQAPLSGSQF